MSFNPENQGTQSPEEAPNVSEPVQSQESKKEAAKLHEAFLRKTFTETHWAEYQTKPSKIPGTDIERSEIFRFERGQIYKAYITVRKEIREAQKRGEDVTNKKKVLEEIRVKANAVEQNLDELNKQYYKNVQQVDIETDYGKFEVPVVELGLKKDNEGEDDKRVPYFFLGGIGMHYQQTAALSMAMALDGHRMYVPMPPEQPSVKKPGDFAHRLSRRKDLKIHADIAKATIRKLGLEKVNVMGFSTGASTLLELASDEDFKADNSLQDLIVLDPLGLEELGLPKLAKRFGLDLGAINSWPYAQARLKIDRQGSHGDLAEPRLFLETGNILSKKLFDSKKLQAINPAGRFQVWVGSDSPLVDKKVLEEVFLGAEETRRQQHENTSPLEIYEVEGGGHNYPMLNSLGVAGIISGEKPSEQITKVKISDLENSAAARIITDINK